MGEQKNMDAMYSRELNGVADIMRYEILFNEAGIAVDTDNCDSGRWTIGR